MHLEIYAIGKLKKSPELSLIHDYDIRIQGLMKPLGFKSLNLKECESKKGLIGVALKKQETQLLLENKQGIVIALDEEGKNISSIDFADVLEKYKDANTPSCRFIIGGADGLDKSLLLDNTIKISFGRLTWPHMMVRAMLYEQIYRCMTILSHHPYHKE